MVLIIKSSNVIQAIASAEQRGARRCRVVNDLVKPSQHLLGFSLVPKDPAGRGATLVPRASVTITCKLDWDVAARWLAEPPYMAPHPDGSLLWYRE